MCAPGRLEGTYNCGPILRLTNHNFHPLLLKMSGDLTPPITQDLMALQAHVSTRPTLLPGNLVAVVSWNAVGEFYLVSQ